MRRIMDVQHAWQVLHGVVVGPLVAVELLIVRVELKQEKYFILKEFFLKICKTIQQEDTQEDIKFIWTMNWPYSY